MKAIKKLLYAYLSKKYMDGCSNYNSAEVRRKFRSKSQGRTAFEKHDLPHAKGDIFTNPLRAIRFAQKHGFPLAIKPNVSGYSRGSHFPIKNYKELWKAALLVKIWWPKSVVEQYLLGSNYRVLATADEVVSIIRRYPPFVIGDGNSSIDTLIDEENATRESMQLHPVIYPIKKSPQIENFLKRQNLGFDSVPAKDERINLFNRVALSPGGVIETIDSTTMHADNEAMFKRVVDAFGANVLGIDVIFEHGLETSYKTQRCILLEVNTRPYMKMHDVPRYGEKPDLRAFYAEMDSLEIVDADIL